MIETKGVDGVPRLYAFTSFGTVNQTDKIYVSVGIPTSVAFAQVNRILNRNIVFLLLITGLSLSAAWFAGDLLVLRKLNLLVNAVKRLGAGDLAIRTCMPYGKGEISQLSQAFDEMAESLERNEENRKRIEEALHHSKERYRLITENTKDLICTLDLEGSFTYVSPSFQETLGYSPEELIGRSSFSLIHPEDKQAVIETFKQALFDKEVRKAEFRYRHKGGNWLVFESVGSWIIDGKGNPEKAVIVSRDIAERKRAEEEKASLEEQLRQSQKMEAIGRLAGGIAHDFNNLLTIIKGYSQLFLMDLKGNDPLKEGLDEIKKASERAAELTCQLLAFSRRQVLEMRVLDLNDVLQNLDKMLRRIIGEDIELVTLTAEKLGRVKTDPGQIEQVIMNLAINARDAMLTGGKLTIETANVYLDETYTHEHADVIPGRYVMFSVSDTGVGMTPEVREHIFEPFFTTKAHGKGTGLGLSTVYGIVKQSGGNIWVYSEPGRGTTLKIYLPQVDESLDEVMESYIKEEVPHGDETILVVEDEEEVRKLIIRVLEKQGYKVLEASNGDEALMVCKELQNSLHLLMTDVVMPGMSGRALAECLAPFHPEMEVLYMSGYTDNAIVHHGILGKELKYIQKPFTVEGLARKVREVLDKDSNNAI